MSSNKKQPFVSIGMPVYNGEATLHAAIDSILAQNFTDFELIISDNASTDRTADICKAFVNNDTRIKYVRQRENVGCYANFNFVFRQSKAKYFMWAAADDIRTSGFIKENIDVLESRQDYVFSSSPNYFLGEESQREKIRTFALEGTLHERLADFLSIRFISHALFYSLIRRESLLNYPDIENQFLAADWSIIIFLLKKGKFARTNGESLGLGADGMSMQMDYYLRERNKRVERVIPFYEFTKRFISIVNVSDELTRGEKLILYTKVMYINLIVWRGKIKKILKSIVGFV